MNQTNKYLIYINYTTRKSIFGLIIKIKAFFIISNKLCLINFSNFTVGLTTFKSSFQTNTSRSRIRIPLQRSKIIPFPGNQSVCARVKLIDLLDCHNFLSQLRHKFN